MLHGVSRGADGLRHAVNESTGGDRSPELGIVIVVPGTVAVMRRRNRMGRRRRGMNAGTAESGAARAAVGGGAAKAGVARLSVQAEARPATEAVNFVKAVMAASLLKRLLGVLS